MCPNPKKSGCLGTISIFMTLLGMCFKTIAPKLIRGATMFAKITIAILLITQTVYSQNGTSVEEFITPEAEEEVESFLSINRVLANIAVGLYRNLIAPSFGIFGALQLVVVKAVLVQFGLMGTVGYALGAIAMVPYYYIIKPLYDYYLQRLFAIIQRMRDFISDTLQGTFFTVQLTDSTTYITRAFDALLNSTYNTLSYLTLGVGNFIYGVLQQLWLVLSTPLALIFGDLFRNLWYSIGYLPITLYNLIRTPIARFGAELTAIPRWMYSLGRNLLRGNFITAGQMLVQLVAYLPLYLVQILGSLGVFLRGIAVNLRVFSRQLFGPLYQIFATTFRGLGLMFNNLYVTIAMLPQMIAALFNNLYNTVASLFTTLGTFLLAAFGDIGVILVNGAVGLGRTLIHVPELIFYPIRSVFYTVVGLLNAIFGNIALGIYRLYASEDSYFRIFINTIGFILRLPFDIIAGILQALNNGIGRYVFNTLYEIYVILRYIFTLRFFDLYNELFELLRSALLLLTDLSEYLSTRFEAIANAIVIGIQSILMGLWVSLTGNRGAYGLVRTITLTTYTLLRNLGQFLLSTLNGQAVLNAIAYLPTQLIRSLLQGLNAIWVYLQTGAINLGQTQVVQGIYTPLYYLGYGIWMASYYTFVTIRFLFT